MSQAPYMPMFVDAYLGDTGHLSTEEHGAYLLLLMAMWRRGGTIPDDDRDNARMTRLSRAKWRATKERLRPFLIFENGAITQKRLKKEWEHVENVRQKQRENGAKGGRPASKENKGLAKANGSDWQNPNESPHTYPSKKESETGIDSDQSLRERERHKPSGGAGAPAEYAFVGRVIRLKPKDFERWKAAYWAIPDFIAELTLADDYYAENPPDKGWFFPVSRWLEKEHNGALEEQRREDKIFAGAI